MDRSTVCKIIQAWIIEQLGIKLNEKLKLNTDIINLMCDYSKNPISFDVLNHGASAEVTLQNSDILDSYWGLKNKTDIAITQRCFSDIILLNNVTFLEHKQNKNQNKKK